MQFWLKIQKDFQPKRPPKRGFGWKCVLTRGALKRCLESEKRHAPWHNLRTEEAGSPFAYSHSHIFPLFWLPRLFREALPEASGFFLASLAAADPFLVSVLAPFFRFWRHFPRHGGPTFSPSGFLLPSMVPLLPVFSHNLTRI